MDELGIYGKIIRDYETDGFMTSNGGQVCKCAIRAVQLADGKIVLKCHFVEDTTIVLSILQKENSVVSIKGDIKDTELTIEGQIFLTNTNIHTTTTGITIDIIIIASSMKVVGHRTEFTDSVRFGLTNFEFYGNKYREYPNGGGAWDILSVNLEGKLVEIYEIQNHKFIMESIKSQKSIDVTCESLIPLTSLGDLDTITDFVDNLCELLSLARGTKINWIYYDCYDSAGKKVVSFHKNSIVWQYVGLPLIDHRNPKDTVSFVEQTFSNYLSYKNDLNTAIETYLDAKRETGFLEIRALKAVVVLEFLNSKYASRKDIDFILHANKFRNVRHAVIDALTEQSKEIPFHPKILDDMILKINELNRFTFRSILETMLHEYNIVMTDVDLDRFIKIRNSLVHKASFLTDNYWDEYCFLLGVLDRIFLKMLNYNGSFLDITNKFARVETPKNYGQIK